MNFRIFHKAIPTIRTSTCNVPGLKTNFEKKTKVFLLYVALTIMNSHYRSTRLTNRKLDLKCLALYWYPEDFGSESAYLGQDLWAFFP